MFFPSKELKKYIYLCQFNQCTKIKELEDGLFNFLHILLGSTQNFSVLIIIYSDSWWQMNEDKPHWGGFSTFWCNHHLRPLTARSNHPPSNYRQPLPWNHRHETITYPVFYSRAKNHSYPWPIWFWSFLLTLAGGFNW